MESHGSKTIATEYMEERCTNRSFNDIEDSWDHNHGFNNLRDDYYDDNNDCDF